MQNNLTYEKGGCWEITGCAFEDGASVGTTYGCKALPPPGWKTSCDANGAWAFNSNNTITSVMSGKCLEVSVSDKKTVEVSACTGTEAHQKRKIPKEIYRSTNASHNFNTIHRFCVPSEVVAVPAFQFMLMCALSMTAYAKR